MYDRTVWVDYEYFTNKWLNRAKRREDIDHVDIGDKFISLWIAFNGWMKNKFGEQMTDKNLLENVIKHVPIQQVFQELKEENTEFKKNLSEIQELPVEDMRFIGSDDKIHVFHYDETFESLMKVIYQVRCNLFHGRKEIYNKDLKLIRLSYQILLPMFDKYLSKNKQDWHF